MIDWLRNHLAAELPGRQAQRRLEPELAAGRHFAPFPDDARRAGVMILLYAYAGDWRLPLTLRPHTLPVHPGQISFPGGLIEPGEDSRQAALRELEEELGVPPACVHVLGQLTPLYVFNSHTGVTPWIGVTEKRPVFLPSPAEVAEVLELPLSRLCDPAALGRHTIERGALRFTAPHIEFAGHYIWGATAMILAELQAMAECWPDYRSKAAGVRST